MSWLQPVTLRSSRVTLAPLERRHREELVEAVKDGELFKLWYTSVPAPESMAQEIDRRLEQQAAGSMLPFVGIGNTTGESPGRTTYLDGHSVNHRVEIGAAWYRKRVQRTDLNTHAKLLLLRHAFETLDCIAVEFRT